ncbi:MAG: hypothetical protein QOJ59_1616 [Thermomicrobiales bacterium]|jgi:predicted transcriptional regulator|nr:hypothetical protein [Thermomicrobiales bacterium]MEA2525331.1 hypothetical protein [Thermomicrobiales bacterium]
MDRLRFIPGSITTPEIRAAVRSQIVGHGRRSSSDIARELGVPHATVVRTLQRFQAVGALRLTLAGTRNDTVVVGVDTLTVRFRDMSCSLW